MKVLCVTTDYDGKWSSFSSKLMLTIGKWYDVEGEDVDYYTVILNKGYRVANDTITANLSKSYFKTVEQLRQEKLTELGV